MLASVSLVSQPEERADAIEVYLHRPGEGTLARAFTSVDRADGAGVLQRATSGLLRGGLTTWVHVGMLVRRARGRADPLQGLDHRDTFLALCRLAQAAVEGVPVQPAGAAQAGAHLRVFSTPHPADAAVARLQQVLQPYAAAGTVTRTGRAVIAWFAIRHLIAVRSSAYSLQVVHLTPDGGGPCQVSLMLPLGDDSPTAGDDARARPGSRRQRRRAQQAAAAAASVAALGPPPAAPAGPGGDPGSTAGPTPVPLQLQAYLDAYREHLTRELLLQPVEAEGPVAGFHWTPEPTGDGGGIAVGGTVPGAVPDDIVLRMAAQAVEQLATRSPEFAGVVWGEPERDGELLVQRWAVGVARTHALSVAARSGDRRRPTQVLIHLEAVAPVRPGDGPADRASDPAAHPARDRDVPSIDMAAIEPPHEVPRTGAAVDTARELTLLPLWWHSANARCDGNDVILYEMPFRGQRLRIRANDYPAEPMYTLLVGDPGAEIAAVDLEDWPTGWTRPRAY